MTAISGERAEQVYELAARKGFDRLTTDAMATQHMGGRRKGVGGLTEGITYGFIGYLEAQPSAEIRAALETASVLA